ncbi:MAG: HAMP domain-containing sensor histidine kinase [Cyanobacteriota bacterium]|nr:HAMP domain-containing sensor histidine kinase [Cyanobacteriota bacterium]
MRYSHRQDRYWHWQLLSGYLVVVGIVVGSSATAMYGFFSRSMHLQVKDELITLAETAAPALETIAQRGLQGLPENTPWRNLSHRRQSLEWFDAEGILLAREGSLFTQLPFPTGSQLQRQTRQSLPDSVQNLHVTVIPVYSPQNSRQLLGYIRASVSDQAVEEILSQLRWGLALGGTVALGVSGMGGLWLARKATEPLAHSYQRLQQFTADASHELRSPLTVIKTSVGVILKHPERVHPQDSKKLIAVTRATARITRLVEDLLLLARTDIHPRLQETTRIPLHELLSELGETLELQAQAKEITLIASPLVPVVVMGDASQLVRLFSNLLENALKYTPKGGSVSLSLKLESHAYLGRNVWIIITDTGVGIAASDLPHIFDRFWRTNKARSLQNGGLGLGLAIAQAIAQQHGGEISVRSQVGVGSSFRVRIPLASSPVVKNAARS